MRQTSKTKKKYLLYIILVFALISCNKSNHYEAPEKKVTDIFRFDKDFYTEDFDSIDNHIIFLNEKYPKFLSLYSNQIINIGSPDHQSFAEYYKRFITDYYVDLIYKRTLNVFEDFTPIENELQNAFLNYQKAFPDSAIPKIYTCISGLNQSVIVDEGSVAIALDKYLGRDCDLYPRADFPMYMIYNMHKNKIATDCMKGFAMTNFPSNDYNSSLINKMIYNGKILYFTQQMLPASHDTLITGFSPQQLTFCVQNEKKMWIFLIEQKYLFKGEQLFINKYTEEGPFTKEFTNESPAGAANWIGLQIVKRYAHNTKTPLSELMNEIDYQKILRESKYNP